MPQISYTEPPATGNVDLDRYLLEMHNRLFGVGSDTSGDLDADNGALPTDTTADEITEGTENLYFTEERVDDRVTDLIQDGEALTWDYNDGAGTLTGEVTKSAAISDAIASTVSVTSADADAVYGTEERDLINEMKGDINTLVTDLNSAITQYNSLMANLRTAKLLAT